MSRLTLLALAWFVGLGLFEWQPSFPFNLVVIPLILLLLAFMGRRVHAAPLLVMLVVGLGYGRLWLADWRPALAGWQPFYGREMILVGVVDEEPTKLTGRVAVKINVEGIVTPGLGAITEGPWETPLQVWEAYDIRSLICQIAPLLCAPRPSVRAWVNLDRLPPSAGGVLLRYGQRVSLQGELTKAPVYDLFPYRETLARQGVYGVLYADTVVLVPFGQRRPIREGAMGLRRYFDTVIQRLFRRDSREAGLLAGILLGLKGRLPDDTVEALRRTSLTHIVVVSGFNITIMAGGLGFLLRLVALGIGWLAGLALKQGRFGLADRCKAVQRFVLPSALPYLALHIMILSIYAVFVGLDPSPVRAALMGMVYVLAKSSGRRSTVLTSVAVTAWAITVVEPWAALDVGFQLSFAATLGLILFQPVIHREMIYWPWLRFLPRGILAPTLAATLATAPIISYYFNQVSVIGLLANVLALPVQPAIMFIGLGAVLLGAVSDGFYTAQSIAGAAPLWLFPFAPEIGLPVDWLAALTRSWLTLIAGLSDSALFVARQLTALTWALLYYTGQVAHGLAQAPFASFDWRANVPFVVLMYAAIGFWAFRRALDHKIIRTDGLALVPSSHPRYATPEPAPAPVAHPTPQPVPPWPAQQPLRPATPVVSLGELGGRPGGRSRRPSRPAPRPTEPRPGYTFGAPATPIAHQPLASFEAPTPTRPSYTFGAPATPIAHQPLASFEASPRRPFEAPTPPAWLPWLRWRIGAGAIAVCALLWLAWPLAVGRPDGLLHLTILERGGTVVARTPNGNRIVIGGGSFTSDTVNEIDWGQWPWDRRLDVLAATRMDRDYLDTLNTLLGRYPVTVALAPPHPRTPAGDTWAKLIRDRSIMQIDTIQSAPVRTLDGVTLEVVAVDEVQRAVAYRLSWGGIRFILASGLRSSLPLTDTPATVVIIDPRMDNALQAQLAQVYRPTLWLVHAEDETGNPDLDRSTLFRVVNLAESGQATLTTDGQRLWMTTER